MGEKNYSVMRWLSDHDRLSVINLQNVTEPARTEIKVGTHGVSKYPGFPGLWTFRVLNIGGYMEMKKWLEVNITMLTEDVTDEFLSSSDQKVSSTCTDEKKIKEHKKKEKKEEKKEIMVCKNDAMKTVGIDILKSRKVLNDSVDETTKTDTENHSVKEEELCDAPPAKKIKTVTGTGSPVTTPPVTKTGPSSVILTEPSRETYVTIKEHNDLKKRVKDLERKLKSSSVPKVSVSTDSKKKELEIPSQKKELEIPSQKKELEIPSEAKEGSDKFNGFSFDELSQSVLPYDNLYECVHTLLLKLYTPDYIITHSVTGQKANLNSPAKPRLDQRLYQVLTNILKAKFAGIKDKDITAKVQTVQKKYKKKI